MSEKRSNEPPRERKKEKEKTTVKKVWGRVTVSEDANARKPGPPSYEHG